jgi:hypothetical protein
MQTVFVVDDIMKISAMAMKLEISARDGDIRMINSETPAFLRIFAQTGHGISLKPGRSLAETGQGISLKAGSSFAQTGQPQGSD